MDLSSFDPRTGMFRTAATAEYQASGTDIETSLYDYITYGTVTAATSAAVGFANTAIALGESLGMADQESYISEEKAIFNMFGQGALDFYGEHKTGVDAAGMIVGSLVPGLGAVRMLRAAQTAGKIYSPLSVTTGLRNPDLLLGSKELAAAKQAVLNSGVSGLRNETVRKAYLAGAQQQFMEAAAFDVAVSLTMNQNSALNPDDLSFLDSATDTFMTGIPFMLAGGVLGSAIDIARTRGEIGKFVKDEFVRTKQLLVPNMGALTGMAAGNKLLTIAETSAVHKDLMKDFDATDSFAAKQFSRGQKQVEDATNDVLTELTDGDRGVIDIIRGLVDTAKEGDLGGVAEKIAFLKKAERVSVKDLKDMQTFYNKTSDITRLVEGDTTSDVTLGVANLFSDLSDSLIASGRAAEAEVLRSYATPENLSSIFHGESVGAAVPNQLLTSVKFKNLKASYVRGSKGSSVAIYSDLAILNKESLDSSLDATNKINKALGFSEVSREDFINTIRFHELGHIKANGRNLRTFLMNTEMEEVANSSFEGLMLDLVESSMHVRRTHWDQHSMSRITKGTERETAKRFLAEMRNPKYDDPSAPRPDFMKYLGSDVELLADAHAVFVNPKSREFAAQKWPKLAEMFNSHGALAQAWDDTRAFYNSRTKQVLSSHLPGISDVSSSSKIVKGKLQVPELSRTFDRNHKVFDEVIAGHSKKLDYLDYDAQWTMVGQKTSQDYLKFLSPKLGGSVKITANDLPEMERLVYLAKTDADVQRMLFDSGKVVYDGNVISRNSLESKLLDIKHDMQLRLAVTQTDDGVGYNAQEISKILNIDVDRAMGIQAGEMMLYGVKDFTKPEVIKMSYASRTPADYESSSINLAESIKRKEMLEEERKQVAAYLLGDTHTVLDSFKMDAGDVGSIAFTESRAGMLNSMRTIMGSFREKAAYVGNVTAAKLAQRTKEVNESYLKSVDLFNRPENAGLRYELANIDNLLRREWYYKATLTNGESAIVNKHAYLAAMKEMVGESFEFHPMMLDSVPEEIIDALNIGSKTSAPNVVAVSREVGDFLSMHMQNNRSIVDKKTKLAGVRGKDTSLDENVLYPPPRDLKSTPYHYFIVPQGSMANSDGRSYMAYGETAAELEAKKDMILKKYGNQYKIVSQREVSDYKRLVDEYNKSMVFDEMYFDANLARSGSASELLPNVDLRSSATLDRYRTWTIRQEESLIRGGVELQYADSIENLKRLDREMHNAERTNLDPKNRERDSIWRETVNIMLNQKSYGGRIEDTYVRVNDYLGEVGSAVLDKAMGMFQRDKGKITNEMIESFNKTLDDNGYQSPLLDISDLILTSPETMKSATLPKLVKTMSGVLSGFMLRLDPLHSVVSTISTPILALPVLQEAKQALKGTAQGKQLESLTGVVNPSNGQYEPTTAMLMAKGTKAFFSPEGKAFLEELKLRNVITDHTTQYLNALDSSTIQGHGKLDKIHTWMENLVEYGAKFSQFRLAEDFGRFQVAWAVKEIGALRGIEQDELWSTILSSVDKVHGVYRGNQRPQVFQGVLGQSVGLFQTYFFNFVQNLTKYVGDGNKTQTRTLVAMQSSLFGIQSWPGFGQLNQMIGESNTGNLDLYSVSGADDPKSMAKYFMYGLASHSLMVPVDFYSRGDLALRHDTVIPTDFGAMPIVSATSKAVGNIINTVGLLTNGDVSVGQALAQGLAHNGLNRPMQGIGQIMRNRITSGNGQIQYDNSNYVDYNMSNELNWGAMFARALGSKPLDEAIITQNYYRSAAYQANYRKKLESLGGDIQTAIKSGMTAEVFSDFAKKYESIGGNIQGFNAYYSRQLSNVQRPVMTEFQSELSRDSELARVRARLEVQQSMQKSWSSDPFIAD